MSKKVRSKLAAAILAASATVAPVDTKACHPAPTMLALAGGVGNDTDRGNLKNSAHRDSKAVFITLTDPSSGFAANSLDVRNFVAGVGRDGELRFDVANLIGISGASALYLGTVNPGNSLISITLGANPTASTATTSNREPNEVPSDPTLLLLFGLCFAAFSVARRAGWI